MQLKELPNNINCEQDLLSGIFYNNKILNDVINKVDVDDFYFKANKVIYAGICAAFVEGKEISLTILIEVIGREQLKSIGGLSYLTDLILNGIAINHMQYIKILKEKSYRRKAIKELNQSIDKLYNSKEDPFNIVEKSLDNLITSNKNINMILDDKALLDKTVEEINKRVKLGGEIPGMKTGIKTFDRNIGGLQKGDLNIIAGRPSMGKTLFSLNVADGLCLNGYKTLLCELEMTEKAIGMRRLSYTSSVEVEKMKFGKLSEEEIERISKATDELSNRNNMFTDCKQDQSLLSIRAKSKSLKQQYGLDVIIIDHLNLMDIPKRETRDLEIGEVTKGLKRLAKELDVCIILICQLKRTVEERKDKKPMLSDLRESGNLEQDADMVAFIYRDEYYNKYTNDKGILECIIGKQRNGRIGTLKFKYNENLQKISDL